MLVEKVKEEFNQYMQASGSDKLSATRTKAYEAFQKLGFPTTRNEEWKYTSLKGIMEKDFNFVSEVNGNVKSFIDALYLKSLVCNRLVFVNGIYSQELSLVIDKDQDIVLSGMSVAWEQHAVVFNKHFGKYAKVEHEGLNAMNTALMQDGAFIYVPDHKIVEHPVLIIHISDSAKLNVVSQPRNLIVVGKNASVKLIETYHSAGGNASFTNVVNEVYADENSSVDHYKIQHQEGESYQNNYTQIFQEANTNINHVTLTLDGTMVRNNLHFFMNGENCNSLLYGLYITGKKNHVDNHTRVDHAKPNCFSNELYKGVLNDKSTAVFNGKIMVHPDAQKTNAYQRNQNILLSDEATINTKPQLEIFADDVKCTHGATVGQLDEEPMFYLRSRGIPEDEARRMMLNAFADAIAEEIRIDALIALLEEEISKKL